MSALRGLLLAAVLAGCGGSEPPPLDATQAVRVGLQQARAACQFTRGNKLVPQDLRAACNALEMAVLATVAVVEPWPAEGSAGAGGAQDH